MPTTKQLYRNLIKDHPLPFCWACGRDDSFCNKPIDWYGPWWIERSHIVRSPREIDRRLIVLLCSLCHQAAHRIKIITAERRDWPSLSVANLLWLKLKRDPEHYDRAYIQRFAVGRLPIARELPAHYLAEYRGRHPK